MNSIVLANTAWLIKTAHATREHTHTVGFGWAVAHLSGLNVEASTFNLCEIGSVRAFWFFKEFLSFVLQVSQTLLNICCEIIEVQFLKGSNSEVLTSCYVVKKEDREYKYWKALEGGIKMGKIPITGIMDDP